MLSEEAYRKMREQMVKEQLEAHQIHDPLVLNAMRTVPRHQFVPQNSRYLAYRDGPLPIGENQTISQPYIVAFMTQLLQLKGGERVLEIGTGSGYQTAVLCEIAGYVYTLERFPRLADRAGQMLTQLGYNNVDIHIGDGSQGLPDMGPFDAILVTAAAPSIPGPLCWQLNPEGGRLVMPVGDYKLQQLQVVRRKADHFTVEKSIKVRFVPLIGRHGFDGDNGDNNGNNDNSSGAAV